MNEEEATLLRLHGVVGTAVTAPVRDAAESQLAMAMVTLQARRPTTLNCAQAVTSIMLCATRGGTPLRSSTLEIACTTLAACDSAPLLLDSVHALTAVHARTTDDAVFAWHSNSVTALTVRVLAAACTIASAPTATPQVVTAALHLLASHAHLPVWWIAHYVDRALRGLTCALSLLPAEAAAEIHPSLTMALDALQLAAPHVKPMLDRVRNHMVAVKAAAVTSVAWRPTPHW